jgi:methionine synthase I (cobalamin-dependent)
MGHLLKSWGVAVDGMPYDQQFLAGVLANLEQPELVVRAHTAYLEAGACALTTNNFVATTYNLSKVQRQQDLERIIQASNHTLASMVFTAASWPLHVQPR